ncbi:ran GTPase activating protein 1 (RNA1 protein) [Talaromyces stipitatus ATCC 10500]|uniref:Ran GTPase activating protein 1 (RNA1 protein) n=1 Tax=Talaromyces stipitatus (strain ATCC 10500 / CBS 375.48 / QM 6759 / NRRL 1006) TaxID=441959 RepID=B8MA89_TALSN|nr:ran GTPase activating protein 1 (RNA1 protein) [Talaromyces stipitatus ATCC 10500]EED18591.1 ran GTPase activating protein 1 (RNA1 protein) [Talaromyces stipitatus ATCC 10500]
MAKIFSLDGKGLKLDTAEDIETHAKPLLEDTTFTEVHLGGNTIGVAASERLAAALATQKNLQVADLADIFTSRLLSEIPPALSALLNALLEIPGLHTVNLSDNAFGLNTQAPLVDYLSRAVPLQHLILNNNGLGPKAGVLVADALTELAKQKEKARSEGKDVPLLESIVCGRNRLENGSMEAWATAYKAHAKGMRSVKMTQNGIRQEGISLLLKAGLSHAAGLEVLDLQDNTFTLLGSNALAKVVQGWASLRELGVGDCLLSARGGIKVAQALAAGKNEKVETLRLQYNDINAEGVKQFLFAAKSSLPALKRIELNGNKFMEDDGNIEELRVLLEKRQEEHGKDEDPEDTWGIDELDELEEDEEEDEDEQDEEEEEEEHLADKTLKETIRAEDEPVSQKKDDDVDALADALGKAGI